MYEVMVQWEESSESRSSIARVHSVASPETLETPTREVVTLYGVPTAESLALALAAAVETRRTAYERLATREVHISETGDAVGDARYHDRATGELIRDDLVIPLTVLKETSADLLKECGQGIRRLLARLLMKDWPEGTRRSLTLELVVASPVRSSDALTAMREADAGNFDDE